MPRHLQKINTALRLAATTPDTVTILSAPPRHGKSTACSHYCPPWFLGNWPDREVILTGYEAEFAASWGRKARDVLTRYGPAVFGVRVRSDSKAANRWGIEGRDGGMQTAGMGGAILGKGANLLIIDDPIKNAEEALSVTVRNKHWDWYRTTAETRLEPGGSVVVIMQRWHSEDLVGRIREDAKSQGRDVVDLRFPAIAESGDVLGREIGEALWPERYPLKRLRQIEKTQGFWFPALYQGRPVPMGGTLFKSEWFDNRRFGFIHTDGPSTEGYTLHDTGEFHLKGDCVHIAVCDPSIGQKNSDRCAIGIFAITPTDRLLVLHVVSERIPVELIPGRLDQLARVWGCESASMEANGFQVTVAKAARRLLNCPVLEVDPEGKGKLTRALPAIDLAHQGDILLPRNEYAPWIAEYMTELCEWTGNDGDRDDQVDITAYAVKQLMKLKDQPWEEPVGGFGRGR